MPHKHNSRLVSSYILVCIFAFFLSTGITSAQNATPAVTKDSISIKVIEPVALSNVGTETEVTLNKIREIRNNIKPSNAEIELDTLIPKRLEVFEKLKKDIDLGEIARMNSRQIEGKKNDITQMRELFKGWRDSFAKKTEEINEMKIELGDIKAQWDETLNLKRAEKIPAQLSDRINNNLKEVITLDKELSNQNNELLTKQDKLTGALIFIDEALNVINKTELSNRLDIYSIDSPPIWAMLSSHAQDTLNVISEQDTLTVRQKVDNIIEIHNNDFESFTENYEVNIYYHLSFFVILILLTFYLKTEVSKWSDEKRDAAIKYSLHIISKPIWSSLLVTLLLTSFFYPEAPSDVMDYYMAMMVFPILMIVPGLIPSINEKYFYVVGGVFVATQLQDYFSDLVVLDRFLLFSIDLLTIVLLVTLLKDHKKIKEADPGIKWGFVFFIMRVSVFLLFVSLITNTIGNTTLSRLLSGGCLPMIYGGVIIYASALILKGLFSLLVQHDKVSKLNMIKNYSDEVKHQVFRAIRFLAVIFWVYITLRGFSIFDPVYDWFVEFFTKERVIGSYAFPIGSFFAFFITLWISLTLSNFIRFILQDEILTHFELPRGVPGAIGMIVKLALIVLGFILAFGAAEIDMSKISILFGALGVGIGFGLQNIFNNLVSGLILAFERPIQVGDTIQVGPLNLMGEVKEIGIRASTIRTFDGAEVIVPNGNLISNEMINWTLSDSRRRQEIIVGVAYGTDTTKVLEILNGVVPEQENVLKNPSPTIIFLGFGDSSLDFRVLFWTRFDAGLGTKSAVGIAIDEAFKKNGIEIPFPQRDLHLRSVSDTVDFQKEKNPVKKVTVKKTAAAKTNKGKEDK